MLTMGMHSKIILRRNRGTFFRFASDICRSRHSDSSGHHRLGKTTHSEVVVPGQKPPVYVRGGQVTDREESHVLAALAVSESSAALR